MARRRAHRDHALRRLRDLAGRSRRAKHPAARKSAQLSRNADTKRNLAIITDREFGERVGIYRMLEIFETEKIRTSFFPTGITVENYPEIFQEIAE